MQEQDPPMFNKFIFDECFIFILLIQFHLHLISFHQRFPHHLHNILPQAFDPCVAETVSRAIKELI